MTTVYRQKEPLTNSQISILTQTYCRWYAAWEARDELHDVLHNKGESNYHIYKCLCKYSGKILEETPKYF